MLACSEFISMPVVVKLAFGISLSTLNNSRDHRPLSKQLRHACSPNILHWINNTLRNDVIDHCGSTLVIITSFLKVVYPLKKSITAYSTSISLEHKVYMCFT